MPQTKIAVMRLWCLLWNEALYACIQTTCKQAVCSKNPIEFSWRSLTLCRVFWILLSTYLSTKMSRTYVGRSNRRAGCCLVVWQQLMKNVVNSHTNQFTILWKNNGKVGYEIIGKKFHDVCKLIAVGISVLLELAI